MENEEKKVNCCENKDGVKCEHGMANCCHHWKKCRVMRIIIGFIVASIIFGLGAQWGEMKSQFRGNRFERGGMMNWGGNRFNNVYRGVQQGDASDVTVDISKTPVAPALPTAPKQ